MACHGMFCRVFNLATATSNSRFILSNSRITFINTHQQNAGLKRDLTERLKDLQIPTKPKKPLTAYLRYVNEHRATVMQDHPDWKLPDVVRKCAADWRLVDDAIKLKYEADFKSEMEAYAKRHLEYSTNLSEEQKIAIKEVNTERKKDRKRRQQKKMFRETNKPKRPVGPYLYYLLEQAKLQNRPYSEMLVINKGKWAEVSPADKEKYEAMALQDKKRYEREMIEWENKMLEDGNVNAVRHATLDSKRAAEAKGTAETIGSNAIKK